MGRMMQVDPGGSWALALRVVGLLRLETVNGHQLSGHTVLSLWNTEGVEVIAGDLRRMLKLKSCADLETDQQQII